jgi:hypothetical protein
MANAYKDIPTLEECQRIKSLNQDLIALLMKYKGNMTSDGGNHLLDLLDGVQVREARSAKALQRIPREEQGGLASRL